MTGKIRRLRYRSGFRASFSLVTLLQSFAVAALLTIAVPWLSWPFPQGSALDRFVAGGVAVAAAVAATLLIRRTPGYRARRELISAASARADGKWLDREARQSFGVFPRFWPWCRMWIITRTGEDDARELDEGGGEQLLAYEDFITIPLTSEVVRLDGVVLVDQAAGTARDLPGGPGVLRSAWRLSRMAKTGAGFVVASLGQVAEVTAQLRAAERIGMQDTGDDSET